MRTTSSRGWAIATVLIALGCGDKAEVSSRKRVAADAAAPAPSVARRTEASATTPAAVQRSVWDDQKLIRTGELEVEVKDVPLTVARMDTIARQFDARIADAHTSDTEGRRDAQLTIRVPSARFDGVMAALRQVGAVRREGVTTEDVTKAYFDLTTRLAVKDEEVTRLRALLANGSGKLSDVLDIERELTRAITELEQFKGEKTYYDQRIAISTIAVGVHEPAAFGRTVSPIAEAMRDAIRTFSQSFAQLIYFVTFLAPWVLLATIVWFATRRLRRPPVPPV